MNDFSRFHHDTRACIKIIHEAVYQNNTQCIRIIHGMGIAKAHEPA